MKTKPRYEESPNKEGIQRYEESPRYEGPKIKKEGQG